MRVRKKRERKRMRERKGSVKDRETEKQISTKEKKKQDIVDSGVIILFYSKRISSVRIKNM